jgi:hypothetical protein
MSVFSTKLSPHVFVKKSLWKRETNGCEFSFIKSIHYGSCFQPNWRTNLLVLELKAEYNNNEVLSWTYSPATSVLYSFNTHNLLIILSPSYYPLGCLSISLSSCCTNKILYTFLVFPIQVTSQIHLITQEFNSDNTKWQTEIIKLIM